MYLFKAKAAAAAELERVCAEQGVTLDQVRAFLTANPKFGSPLHKPPHKVAGSAGDLVTEVAPLIKQSGWERTASKARGAAKATAEVLRDSPRAISESATRAAAKASVIAGWLKEDLATYREARASAATKVANP
jgi:hypothetical protein